jgi:hypothetical protein
MTMRCSACELLGLEESAVCLVEWTPPLRKEKDYDPMCDTCAFLLLLWNPDARRLPMDTVVRIKLAREPGGRWAAVEETSGARAWFDKEPTRGELLAGLCVRGMRPTLGKIAVVERVGDAARMKG